MTSYPWGKPAGRGGSREPLISPGGVTDVEESSSTLSLFPEREGEGWDLGIIQKLGFRSSLRDFKQNA